MSLKYRLSSGSRVIITGASSGIGRALAIKLAKDYSAKLVLNARNEKLLSETAKLVQQAGGQAQVIAGDISNKETASKLAVSCIEKFGGIDLLVNNAGLTKPGTVTALTLEDWEFVFSINFFGSLYAIYAVLPHMLQAGRGKIVNVASVAGKIALPGSVCYASTKFALTGLSEGMAAELASKNIDVITVCPGLVRTEFFDNNNMIKRTNPTIIAQQNNFSGWLMRNLISISSEQAADSIIKACKAGGSQEMVLTIPGIILDRLSGFAPRLAFALAARVNPQRTQPNSQ